MGTDIKISIEIKGDDGKWFEFQPSYPSWKCGGLVGGDFEIPRSGILFDALSFGTGIPKWGKVIKGLPDDVSDSFKGLVEDWGDVYGYAHLYFKDFQYSKSYGQYVNDVVSPYLQEKGYTGERLEEELDVLMDRFSNLSSKVRHHLDCAGFPYWKDDNINRVRIVYGFYQ